MQALRFILARQKQSKTGILFAPQLMLRARTERFLQLVKLIIATFALSRDAKKV